MKGLLRGLERVEVALGIMVAGTLASILVIASACVVLLVSSGKQTDYITDWLFYACTGGLLLAGLMMAWLCRMIVRAFEQRRPYPLLRATRQFRRGRWPTRWIKGIVALLGALAVLAFAELWVGRWRIDEVFQPLNPILLTLWLTVTIGASFAFNTYLVAALRGFNMPNGLVRHTIRQRLAIDVAVAIGISLVDWATLLR